MRPLIDPPYHVMRGGTGIHAGSHVEVVDALSRSILRVMRIDGETNDQRERRAKKLCKLMNCASC